MNGADVLLEFRTTILLSVGAGVAAYVALSFLLASKSGRGLVDWRLAHSRWVDRGFFILAVGYVLIFSSLAIANQLALSADHLDLAQYDQLVWNSMQGRLLENTYVRDAPMFLGKSFTPILLAFVPLYAVWHDPIVLLVVQIVALGLGGFPIYWFAREKLGRGLAFIVGLTYFLSPWLGNVFITDFHEIILAIPLLSLATYLLLHRRYKAFLATLVVTLMVKEEIAFVAVALGIYIALVQGQRRLGVGLALFGAIWGWLLLQYVIPFFRGAAPGDFYYFGSGKIAGGGTRYAYLGRSFSEIISTVITRPDIVLQHLLVPAKIEYTLYLLVPLAFIPLVGFEVAALALPTFAYSVLSDYSWQFSIQAPYYAAALLPFLFFALVVGLQRLLKWSNRITFLPWRNPDPAISDMIHRGMLSAILAATSVSSYYLYSPTPLGRLFQPELFAVSSHTLTGIALLETIPHDATVEAQTQLLHRVSERQYAYEMPAIPDYRQADYIVFDRTNVWYQVHKAYWDGYLSSGYFDILLQQDGYVIAKRAQPEHSLQIQFGDKMTLLGYTMVATDTLRGGTTLRPVVAWQAKQPISDRYGFRVQVVDADGHVWAEEDREPDGGFTPTNQWRLDKSVGDQYDLKLPPTMPAGDYQIIVAIHKLAKDNSDQAEELLGSEQVITTVHIAKNKSSLVVSQLQIENLHFVDMAEMRFLGYVPPRKTISPGELLQVGMYWRARDKPRGDYIVAVQLRDASGRVVFEQSSRPAKDSYPTTDWDAGEVLLDWHDFYLPEEILVGDYKIWVALRDRNANRSLGETEISALQIVR